MLARPPSSPTRGPTGSWPTAPTAPSWPTLAQLTVGQHHSMLARPTSCPTRGPTTVGQHAEAVGSRSELDNLEPTAVGVVVTQPRPGADGFAQLHNCTRKSLEGSTHLVPYPTYNGSTIKQLGSCCSVSSHHGHSSVLIANSLLLELQADFTKG